MKRVEAPASPQQRHGGGDVHKTVLAQALRWHLQGRVLAYGRKTVVFD